MDNAQIIYYGIMLAKGLAIFLVGYCMGVPRGIAKERKFVEEQKEKYMRAESFRNFTEQFRGEYERK